MATVYLFPGAERGLSERGRGERGLSEPGRGERALSEVGRVEVGRVERGRVERGRVERGRVKVGRTGAASARRQGVPVAGRRPGGVPASLGAHRPGVGPMRLTRRGRIVVRAALVLAVGVIVAGAVLLASRPAMAGNGGHPVSARYHVVMPGETMLQIAAQEVPGVDPRDTVIRILDLNALSSSAVWPGQRIALPVGVGSSRR
jgi:hypothetical protein